MAFFAKPPEGADHSLKCAESKIRHHFYFKNFSKLTTFMIGQKKFNLKNNSVEYFLELWGSVLPYFWVFLEIMFKK